MLIASGLAWLPLLIALACPLMMIAMMGDAWWPRPRGAEALQADDP
jgi:hypothetical protein